MAKYRLNIGQFGRRVGEAIEEYKPGDVFESDVDLRKHNAPGELGAKFTKLDDGDEAAPGFHWDPAVESLEDFVERVSQHGVHHADSGAAVARG